MKVPAKEKCLELIQKYEMTENVRAHSEQVRKVANFIAKKIKENGKKIDLEAIDKGALLHDLMKIHCIKNDCRHATEAEKVLAKEGYKEFGKLLKMHGLEEVNNFNEKTPLEAKIIWYADKRVTHDKIVSLKERYEYLKEKYGKKSEQKMKEILSTTQNAEKIEKELLELAKIKDLDELK
ncbi:MAG: HDIG domain-containing protein [Candidatus Diapherotrites archaeon]